MAFGENGEVIAKKSSGFHVGIIQKTKPTSDGIGMGGIGRANALKFY